MQLKKGIYEHLINNKINQDIHESEHQGLICKQEAIDNAESPSMLANYLAKIIRQKLEDTEEHSERIKLINSIIKNAGILKDHELVSKSDILSEVLSKQQATLQEASQTKTIRPISGFRVSNLFTGGASSLSLGEEIRREIASADEIYLIVSFLRVSGVRILLNDLKKFCERDGTRLRIITTTYCGATEAKAIEQLINLPNTEIKISYNTKVERLHAKSYIFVRHSGMNTAYIGSSNLSKSAQTDGLEWNMRVTSIENPHIIKTALATFDLYWNSPNFEDFRIGGIEKFYTELKNQQTSPRHTTTTYQSFILLPHQKQILEKLRVEREELNNHKNLIVAATGTGKTVISAFDYKEFVRTHPKANILFTAHREEILEQSLATYRSVLQNPNFGAKWVGNHKPQHDDDFKHLFVSISMLNSRFDEVFANISPDFYDYIVIDEAHHSQADSYRKLFTYFTPKLLIGLTATPERMDGQDLRPDFNNRISAEIRLPQALQAGLLTPFQYFCVSDNVDLRSTHLWSGQKYHVDKLAHELCKESRTNIITNALKRYLANEHTCRALCFCVNKHHAHFMAEQLRKNGFKAQSLTSDTPSYERKNLAEQLRKGTELNYLCVVDIFNEGVDIPEIDTVLFLRPTESLTIFLQQLGRGLRLSVGKNELTVLDFVGQANQKYDFSSRFRALTLNNGNKIRSQIQHGFTSLPYGCSIIMEKQAQQHILNNIKYAIYNSRRIAQEINSYPIIPSLAQFLENNGQDIRILYQNNNCWTTHKRNANKISYQDDAISKRLIKGMRHLLHYNSVSFLKFIEEFIKTKDNSKLLDSNKSYAVMLYYALFQDTIKNAGFSSIIEALNLLHKQQYSHFKDEILEIISYLLTHLQIKTKPIQDLKFKGLELYGCYTREDIFTLAGRQTAEKKMQGSVAGVFNLEEHNTYLLFVTLNKSEKDFSPSTQYNDYLIDEWQFHWQSQNTDSHNNKGGQRYTNQAKKESKILLFVRQEKNDEFGNTSAFHCFGLVDYISSEGDCPMNIQWKLQEPAMARYIKAI